MDEFEPVDGTAERNLACPHFIACHDVRYDALDADAGCTLERVIVHVRPSDGKGYPLRLERMCLFAELFGVPGDYTLHVRMLRIRVTDDGEVVQARRDFNSRAVELSGENYVECVVWVLPDVWFSEPSVYEFQLWADGFDEPLARERIAARE